jgi:hypothetical protein
VKSLYFEKKIRNTIRGSTKEQSRKFKKYQLCRPTVTSWNTEGGHCRKLQSGTWDRVRLRYVQRVGVNESHYTHSIRMQNQFRVTQHNTHCEVRWQSGDNMKDKWPPLPGNLVVLSVWLTGSYSNQEHMPAFRTIILQILRRLSQRSRTASACVPSVEMHVRTHWTFNLEMTHRFK